MRPPLRGGGGGFRGRGDRGRGGGGRGGGRGFQRFDEGPPESVTEVGTFMHACEGEAVCKLTNEKVPYFNGPIFLENKTQVGKVEEIFGPIKQSMFTVKMQEGVVASSYAAGDKFFIDPMKLLPLERFLNAEKPRGGGRGGRGGPGGRGGGRGRGAPRGRGGFAPRGGAGGFRGRGPPRGGGFRGRGRG